jgi:glycosyltransferase involved in cell wall biosynthesis
VSLPPIIFVLLQTDAAADGGISSVMQVVAGLRRHRPIIVTDRESPRVDEWRAAGIETHVIPQTAARGLARDPIGTLRSYWRYGRELRRLVRRSGAKVVHANDPLALQLALAPARSTGAAIVLNMRDTIDPDRPPPRRRYRFVFGAADHVFYLSNDMADRWAKIAPNAKRVCSVTYSIVDPFKFLSSPLPQDEPPVVLISGLIRPKKGQLEFLRQVAPALAAHGISTWLAGDYEPSADPYMAACAEAAAPLGDAVQFLGHRGDVASLMQRAMVVAVPSRYEGLVRSMIEAMSCARPVVSFDISSARELLEMQSGGAGKVVDFGDYEAMTSAIFEYCSDRQLATGAGEKGRAAASRLMSTGEVIRRYESVYEALESRG